MTWIKMDDALMENDKIRRAGKDGTLLYVAGLCYCGQKLTDGFIPEYDVPILLAWARVDDDKAAVAALTAHEDDKNPLWEPVSGGYMVHDYLVYNPTREEVLERRRKRAESGKQGGYESGRVRRAAKAEREQEPAREASASLDASANGEANGQANDEAPANPVSPYPGPHNPGPEGVESAAALSPEAQERPPPKAKRGLSPEQRQRNAVVRALRDYFSAKTGLSPPVVRGDGQRREAATQWWNPLREIAQLVDWDVGAGQALIDAVVAKLRKGDCTVQAPISIVKTARGREALVRVKTDRDRYVKGEYGHRVKH